MLNRTVKEKILKIMELGLEVNRREKNTVFIRFSGHCEIFEVSIHSKGWKEGLGADFLKIFILVVHQKMKLEKN